MDVRQLRRYRALLTETRASAADVRGGIVGAILKLEEIDDDEFRFFGAIVA